MAIETFNFLAPEITQADLVAFSDNKVNLKREHLDKYRAQVARLREHLDRYIGEHPDIGLVKMLESGSLAKGTALRTTDDIDVAVYVKAEGAPDDIAKLLDWLAERLRTTYHQTPNQSIYVDGPCVVISFGNGLDVDVAPILYFGDPEWRGYLWDRSTRKKVLTSIPLHVNFIKKRKGTHPVHFRQTIRLLKWWVALRERDTPGFTLRSFIVELLVAHLADTGTKFDDYHRGIEHFFTYIQRSGLKDRIAFADNYPASKLPVKRASIVEIFDPVNPENNVASEISESQRRQLVEMASNALDALSYARNSQTKSDALECWRELMGASFSA